MVKKLIIVLFVYPTLIYGWTETSPLPAGRAYHRSVVYNGSIRVIGGSVR